MIKLKDEIYEFKGISNVREVARGILLDEDNNIILETLYRDDEFGESKYVETPGGGVNVNESYSGALVREIREELGYNIKVIQYIEVVEDYYNLIKRKNRSYYFLCKVVSKTTSHKEERELEMITGEVHLNIDDAIKMMEENVGGVGILVKNRELPILKLAKELLRGRYE